MWYRTRVSESAPSAGRTTVTLGTATPGGGFPVYGQAVADTINEVDATLDVQPRNTKGSTENVPLLEAGSLDLALVQGEVVHEALDRRRPRRRRTCASSPRCTPPPACSWCGPTRPTGRSTTSRAGRSRSARADSGLIILARYVLDGLGLDRDRDFQAVLLDAAGDGPAMVMDGRAAALWGGGIGWPGFTAVARGPAGARFLVPDLDGIQRIQRKHPFLKLMLVPAGSYPGQNAASCTRWARGASSWRGRRSPTRSAYRLARALHRGEAALGARLAQARETTAANTVAAVARPELLHPGVRRYLVEAGLLAR